MSLSRAAIVDQLKEIVGADRVITDETVLKKNSIDRFRKFPDIHGIYTLPIPAAVVKLGSTEQVSRVLNFMNAHKINGVPRTGASATEGGLETVVENSVVLDGSAMNQIINIDIENMQATAQCGVPLEVLENALREKGYTTGHSPQSKPLAQMGGLVATRSIGQFSTLYGAIEDMVVGLEAVLADGTVTRIKNVPRRAAGPDIRHIIIGNEGALCYITEVTVKIFKFTPENNLFYGYILEDMKTGFNILREIMVEGYRPSIARLYDAEDGTQHFTHFADGKCVLIFMAEGNPRIAKVTGEGIAEIVARYPQCQRVDSKLIETWFNNLNWGPDKVAAERVQILKTGNMGFTTEVSVLGPNVDSGVVSRGPQLAEAPRRPTESRARGCLPNIPRRRDSPLDRVRVTFAAQMTDCKGGWPNRWRPTAASFDAHGRVSGSSVPEPSRRRSSPSGASS